jgi:hypothetical protein
MEYGIKNTRPMKHAIILMTLIFLSKIAVCYTIKVKTLFCVYFHADSIHALGLEFGL